MQGETEPPTTYMNKEDYEYGMAANVIESDRILRKDTKVWCIRFMQQQMVVLGLNKQGRKVKKVLPIFRLDNFRVKWIPEKDREDPWCWYFCGRKEYMEAGAIKFNMIANNERLAHPNRKKVHETNYVRLGLA